MPIELKHVSCIYGKGTASEVQALQDVSLKISDGSFIGMIGRTGSGKSTLIQHLNGLIRPTEGTVLYNGEDIWAPGYNRRDLRFQVGLVFQYPEHQLFESTVLKDVCFGPKNQGLPEEECISRAQEALKLLQVPEEIFSRSPFALSGGQKRRVAIAGILAMEPSVLVLDEPTAGLDPKGREDVLELLSAIRRERKITVVLVSHSMEDVAAYADRIVVMHRGRVFADGTPREVFAKADDLEAIGLAAPAITYVMRDLKKRGLDTDENATTVEEAAESVLRALGRNVPGEA